MTKRNAANERVKHRYLQFLADVKGRDGTRRSMPSRPRSSGSRNRLRRRDFKQFHIEQARAFKKDLMIARSERTAEPLSASTIHSLLGALKAFFIWLAQEAGYRSRIKTSDAEYFNPPDNLSRVATARR